jgi:enterobacterial common antigen flippase
VSVSGKLLLIAVIQVLTILVGLVRSKGLALILGPASFGVVSTIDQVLITAGTLGGLALPFTALKFMARAHSESESAFQRTAAGFLRLMATLAIIATGVAWAVLAWQPDAFGGDLVVHEGALETALLGIPSAMLLILFVNTFAAARRPVAAAALNLAGVAALAMMAVIGARWRGIDGLYSLTVPAALLITGVGLYAIHRALGVPYAARHTGIIRALRSEPAIVGVSLSLYATFAASSVMMLIARTTVLSALGAADVGRLQAAFSIALTVGAVLYPLTNLYLGPLVNRRGAIQEKLRAVDAFVSRMLLLLVVGALPALLFPALLLRLLFSVEFAPVAVVLWVFVLWQCVFQIAYVYQQLLIGLDDVVFPAGALIGGCTIAVALMEPLTKRLGLGGVAIALTVGMAVWGVATGLRIRFKHGGTISKRVLARVAGVILIVSVTGAFFAHRHEMSLSGVGERILAAVIAAAICFSLLDPHERDPRLWLAMLRPRAQS